ncbi:MAG: ribonuclease P protein component [Patescibacteria group bacterium]
MPHKFIFIVSKKVAKTAVARNRLKRRARAIARELASKLPIRTYKIYFKSGDSELTYKQLKNKLNAFFNF